jgi:hypothetical protein
VESLPEPGIEKRGITMKVRWAAVGGAIVCAVAATGAFATGHFTAGESLQACANSVNGQLRLVESADECHPSETAVSWPASASGGATTFVTVTETVAPAASGLTSATATCPAGGRVVGGGGAATPVTGGNVLGTAPAGDGAWTATAATNPSAQSFSAYAICATS